MGCAIFPQDGGDAEKLLAEADRRMYIVKQQHYNDRKAMILPTPSAGEEMHFQA
jgi:GGDEF domain-containing protein